MNSLQIIALIFSILLLIKIIFVIFKPDLWLEKTEKFLNKKILLIWIPLTIIIGYFVFQQVAIYKIAAIMFFCAMLMAITFLEFDDFFVEIRRKVQKINIKNFWFSLLIWAIFAIIVLIDLFL